MKQTKQCPSCQSHDIFTQDVAARGRYGPDFLPGVGGFWKPAHFEVYVCGACGYTQFYVPQKLLERVQKKFFRLGASKVDPNPYDLLAQEEAAEEQAHEEPATADVPASPAPAVGLSDALPKKPVPYRARTFYSGDGESG